MPNGSSNGSRTFTILIAVAPTLAAIIGAAFILPITFVSKSDVIEFRTQYIEDIRQLHGDIAQLHTEGLRVYEELSAMKSLLSKIDERQQVNNTLLETSRVDRQKSDEMLEYRVRALENRSTHTTAGEPSSQGGPQ